MSSLQWKSVALWALGSLLLLGCVPLGSGQAGSTLGHHKAGPGLGARLRSLAGGSAAAAAVEAGPLLADDALSNISATYKGEWSKRTWRKRMESSGALQQRGGVAVLKLRSLGLTDGGVSSIEGEMVLRDGRYVSGGDVLLNLQGVYVPTVGRLLAVVEPAVPIKLPARSSRRRQQQHERLAHAGSSWDDGGLAELGDADVGPTLGLAATGRGSRAAAAKRAAAQLRLEDAGEGEVLRAAAQQVALLAAKLREEGLDTDDMPDPSLAFEEAHSWQRCEFRLDMWVVPAAHSSSSSAAAAGAAALAGTGSRHAAADDGGAAAAARALGRRMVPGGGRRFGPGLARPREGDLVLNGTLTSRNCGTRLVISLGTAHAEAYYAKAVNYTLMITALGLLQVLLLVRQMEAVSTPGLASRVSLLMLAHQAVLDAYLCLVHLTLGIMVESLFHSFGTVAFMQFVVFAIFETRFLLSVWRARRGGVDPWTAQREVSVLYARFYATLLGGILLTYQLQRHMPVLLFVFFSFWWPQIIHSARQDTRQPLKPEFVLGTSVARLALPAYVYACPSNLLRVAPNLGLCAALVAWVGLQCALLLLQYYRGPRCFIPKAFLPKRYDYNRPFPPALGAGGDVEAGEGGGRECVICMQLVEAGSKTQRAVTPCNHVFHASCLSRWLTVKHDCPTCRRLLPPL